MLGATADDREKRPGQRRLRTQRRLYSVQEVALWLGCQPGSLRDPRYRTRIGLAAIRIGGRLMFAEDDVEQLLARNREQLPMATSEDNDLR